MSYLAPRRASPSIFDLCAGPPTRKFSKMTNKDKVERVYAILKTALPATIVRQLTFLPPGKTGARKNPDVCRGRIRGEVRNHIWDGTWCFYEVGVGRYNDFDAVGNVGAIGFVVSKKCASRWATALQQLLAQQTKRDARFIRKISKKGAITLFRYYTKPQFSSFPEDHGAAALAVLICDSYKKLNAFSV